MAVMAMLEGLWPLFAEALAREEDARLPELIEGNRSGEVRGVLGLSGSFDSAAPPVSDELLAQIRADAQQPIPMIRYTTGDDLRRGMAVFAEHCRSEADRRREAEITWDRLICHAAKAIDGLDAPPVGRERKEPFEDVTWGDILAWYARHIPAMRPCYEHVTYDRDESGKTIITAWWFE